MELGGVSIDTESFYVGWGTLTLINAGLAQAKGRSGLAWWLGSLFLGPLATFLIVVLEDPRAREARLDGYLAWRRERDARTRTDRGVPPDTERR